MAKQKTAFRGNPNLKRAGVLIDWTPELLQEYFKCSEDPIYFAEKYIKIVHVDRGLIPLELYDYQRELIKMMHENRRVAANQSRQSGKSTSVVAYLLWFVLFNKNKTVGILANKGETAREILGKLQLAYQHLPFWIQAGVLEFNKGSILLENQSRVVAAATSSDNVRGFSFAVIYLDEMAFIENYDEFFASVFPTISSGKETKIIGTSTPKGLNHFYKVMELGKKGLNGFKTIEIPWYKVPGRDEQWKQDTLAALNFDMQKFNVEYNIEFLGSTNTLIAGWKLKEMFHEIPLKEHEGFKQYEQPKKNHFYTIIADVSEGKGQDYSAFSVIDITSMPYRQVACYRNNEILATDYGQILLNVAKQYNEAQILVETNMLGAQICEQLYNDYEYINVIQTETSASKKNVSQGFGGKRTELGIKTTKSVKATGCSIAKMLIEQNQLILVDEATIDEFKTFSKKNKSYEAEKDKHDDMVMTIVLFSWLTDQKFFKELTDINTLNKLRDFTEKQIEEAITPFFLVDRSSSGSELISFEGQLIDPDDINDPFNPDFDVSF